MRIKNGTPTLHDVAFAANVSTATVSRCLNFPNKVSAATRQKVSAAISELGYLPNFGAKVMATNRTNTIGAIIPTMENAIFARGLQAFQEELLLHGFTLLVASTSYRPEIEQEQIRALVARGADALLLIGHERDPEIYRFLENQGVAALTAWAYNSQAERPSVGFDNRAAMREMAVKVIEMGHRKLALISAQRATNDRAQARHSGILDAMAENGLDPNDLYLLETTYGIEEGAQAFKQVMAANTGATAVFCGNDVLAVGALRSARELKLNVPNDVSIIGFDDIELAQVAYPALTTVHVPHREMGVFAAKALANLIKEGTALKSIPLKTKLVFRDTLAAVAP